MQPHSIERLRSCFTHINAKKKTLAGSYLIQFIYIVAHEYMKTRHLRRTASHSNRQRKGEEFTYVGTTQLWCRIPISACSRPDVPLGTNAGYHIPRQVCQNAVLLLLHPDPQCTSVAGWSPTQRHSIQLYLYGGAVTAGTRP
jgi:hypothetical protein